jgi:hypothetical protein
MMSFKQLAVGPPTPSGASARGFKLASTDRGLCQEARAHRGISAFVRSPWPKNAVRRSNRAHRHVEASANGSLRAQLDLGIELFSLGSARIGHAALSCPELHLGRLGSMGKIRLLTSPASAAELHRKSKGHSGQPGRHEDAYSAGAVASPWRGLICQDTPASLLCSRSSSR